MVFGPEDLAVLAFAVALDLTLGEPPKWAHPTVWMGGQIKFVERWMPKKGLAMSTGRELAYSGTTERR